MPIYQNDVCPVCGENPNLQYICESCREVFCEDCVDLHTEEQFICIRCGGQEVKLDKYEQPVCQACGSSEVRTANKVVPTCRTCESTQVVRIIDKQKQLLDDYKQIITNTRNFLTPLENLMEKLHHIRNQLFELRQEHPPCHHYPTLESDILLLSKLFDNGKNRVYDQANRFFQEIQRNIQFINEIQITHPSNFPYIGEILLHFERDRKKVENLAYTEVEPLLARFEPLNDRVDFMERMQALFNKFLPKMNLGSEERIVYGLNCKLSSGANSQQDFSNKNGTILITNQRIYFYHEQGVFKKQTVLLFSVKLADLQTAEVKGKLKKKVSLQFLNSMYDFTLSKEKRAVLVKWIERAQEFDLKNSFDENQIKKLLKYRLSTKLFNEELENAIYNLVGYHGLRNVPRNTQSPNSNIFNTQMFRASFLPDPNSVPRRAVPRQNPMAPRGYSAQANGRFGPPQPRNQFSRRATPKYPPRQPRQPRIPRYQHSQQPYPRFPSSHTSDRSAGIGPGHYGYPHDKPHSSFNSPPTQQNFTRNQSQFGYSEGANSHFTNPNSAVYGQADRPSMFSPSNQWPEQNSRDNTSKTFHPRSNVPFSQPRSDFSSYSPSSSQPARAFGGGDRFSSEEMSIRAELNQLRGDQYAFQTTLQKLEYQYDRGVISNEEFVKAYQDLSRENYIISNKIEHLESYLRENFD